MASDKFFQIDLVAVFDEEADFFETLDGLVGARLHDPVDHLNDVLVNTRISTCSCFRLKHLSQVLTSFDDLAG